MASFTSIPTEVVLMILGELEYASEVSVLGQTCRHLHEIADDYLSTHYAPTYSPHGLHRIIEKGNVDAFNKILLAGVEFDTPFYRRASSEQTPLRLAASKGQVTIIDAFARFFGPSAVTDRAYEVAKEAVQNGHIAVLDLLLWVGVSLDIPDEFNMRTILSVAAEHGQLESVQFLFNNGCNINSWDVFQQTPLWWACKQGHLDVVKFLVETGADPDFASTEFPRTEPIYIAAIGGHRAVVQYLLDQGAHPDFKTKANIEALAKLAIAERQKEETILPQLFDRVDVDTELGWSSEERRYSLLMCAAACGHKDMAIKIKDEGCRFDHRHERYSAISVAASHGHDDVVSFLLRRREDSSSELQMALWEGAAARQKNVVELCIMGATQAELKELGTSAVTEALPYPAICDYVFKEAKVLRKLDGDGDKDEVVQEAIRVGNLRALGHLLGWTRRRQWDDTGYLEHSYVGDPNRRRFNVIEYAAAIGNVDSFNYILDKPWKKPDPTDKRWRSVLFLAATHKRVEIVEIFLKRGFDVNALYGDDPRDPRLPRDPGRPLVMSFIGYHNLIAIKDIEERRMEGVRLLADWGVDVNVMDGNGETALGLATRCKDMKMVKELMRLGADPFAGGHFTMTAFYKAFADNTSPISLQFLELYIEYGQEHGCYPDFERLFELASVSKGDGEREENNVDADAEDDENDVDADHEKDDANWDPKPTEDGFSETGWLKFLKMKRVRFFYWHLRNLTPTPKW